MKPLHEMRTRTPRGAMRRFMGVVGRRAWTARMRSLEAHIAGQPALRHVVQRRHLLEMAFDQLDRRVRRAGPDRPLPPQYAALAEIAGLVGDTAEALNAKGEKALKARLAAALEDGGALSAALHPFAVARRFLQLGFSVSFPDLEDKAPYDLLVEKDGTAAEVVCVAVASDAGRSVDSADWSRLVGEIDGAMQAYVDGRPGRYVLKLSLPEGLAGDTGIADIRDAVVELLADNQRSARAESVVMKLDPLNLGSDPISQDDLHQVLRAQFGPAASLAIGMFGDSAFAIAGRSGKPDDIARGVLDQLVDVPRRFGGDRPGLLFTLVDDVSAVEWTSLRDRMELEVAGRELLNRAENAPVHSVAFVSVADMVTEGPPGFARHRSLCVLNPKHPQARAADLALCPA